MDFKLTPVSMPTTVRPSLGARAAPAAAGEGGGGDFLVRSNRP